MAVAAWSVDMGHSLAPSLSRSYLSPCAQSEGGRRGRRGRRGREESESESESESEKQKNSKSLVSFPSFYFRTAR